MTALVTVDSVTSVAAYESMCRWITESESLAECKDIADKTAALKEYARRIKNTEAERRAVNVRLIAERRYGELLKQLARVPPQEAVRSGRATKVSPAVVAGDSAYREAIARDQISERTAQRYQALAAVPKPVFDEALSDPRAKPTVRALIEQSKPLQAKMPDDVLWIWGRMRDFERDRYMGKDPAKLLDSMTDSMRADVARIAPLMAEFFTKMEEVSHEHV